jgi:hypothetical protein
MRKLIGLLIVAATLAACSRGGSDGQSGPDEFSILPARPLEAPATLDLPAPTPGGVNLTDASATAAAIIALGGRDTAGAGVPAADSALVAYASRLGVDSSIRATLAAEDANILDRRGWLSSLRRGDDYLKKYARFALDAYAELERFRAAGAAVPSAPPQN